MADWTRLHHETVEECASESCGHSRAHWRMEAGGTGSFFCAQCAAKIAARDPGILLPCPCCGGVAWFDNTRGYSDHEGHRTFWSVRCKSCDLRTPAIANPITPVQNWNRRSTS